MRPRQGSAVVVLDYRIHGGVGLLPHLLAHPDLSLLEPFLRLRRVLAAEAVAAAAEGVDPGTLSELEAHAQILSQTLDLDALMEGNLAFSARILDIADNLPMRLLFNTVAAVVRGRPEVRDAMLRDADAVRASFPAVVALIRAGDPQIARAAVMRTLTAIDRSSLTTPETP